MKSSAKIRLATVTILVLLGAGCAVLGGLYLRESNKCQQLEIQLAELAKQEKQSTIMQSINKQMEDIAYQQKEISDEQREEAIQQTRVANQMREQAVIESTRAREAERNAVASEQKAHQASAIAEQQRLLAEHQRIQAEIARNKADTLSYRALGRSLGSLSTIQYQAGNDTIANLLAYASQLYTARYKDDLYHPAVLNALMDASKSKLTWPVHHGALMSIAFFQGSDNVLISASSYGELTRYEKQGNELKTTELFNNNSYDFRSVYLDKNGVAYAVSRSGHLVIVHNKNDIKVINLDKVDYPTSIVPMENGNMVIVGEQTMVFLDGNNKQIKSHTFNHKITAVSYSINHPVIFDDNGNMYTVVDNDQIVTTKTPVKGSITAFATSKETMADAYGTSDGTIYIIDKDKRIKKLVGHRSRISRLKFHGDRLYSSSYDGTMNLWMTSNEKVEPLQLFSTGSWIMYFTSDPSQKNIWTGDQNGYLTQALIDIPSMVSAIKKKLKRNMTTEEWNYYIGKDVPYETFIDRKEVRP